MQLFHRNSLVSAFKIPLWGQVAEETPPNWLVSRLQTGELEINRLGGLTVNTPFGVQQSLPGDVVILFADNSIGFEKPEKFERDFAPVKELPLAA
ncbi:hypothetical protein FXV83_16425 [Bradyrhizobium hipponense]|uniref:Uncharacterized protein n=1 Tax=Bradyrhizobium hipponense TaxID=2605638 RepID=A0A5S4YM80_9BRAD|nr:hypothetical protein [Bradyrhizobium hipponense]TYO65516.1 hypothetical protein FXV83_16425 [Bradyrhizobium hipponense]